MALVLHLDGDGPRLSDVSMDDVCNGVGGGAVAALGWVVERWCRKVEEGSYAIPSFATRYEE